MKSFQEKTTPKVTIHMVSSLDGYVAREDGDLAWMETQDSYEDGVELTDEYISEFLNSIDCYVMGSTTYEQAISHGWLYGDKPVFVLTHRALSSEKESVEFWNGDLKVLIEGRLKQDFHNIWMVGGPDATKQFLQLGLADEVVVTIIPIILGGGLPYFDAIGKEICLHLKDVTAYKEGMVEMIYEVGKS